MRFFLTKISALKSGWNERPLTEDDFYRLCRRHRVTVQEMPLRVSGFYYCMLGRHFIAINSRLRGYEKLFVMFHEFAHFLMHAPDTGTTANFLGVGKKTRKEKEADLFALCAIIPKPRLAPDLIEEMINEEGFTREMIDERIKLFHESGI